MDKLRRSPHKAVIRHNGSQHAAESEDCGGSEQKHDVGRRT